MEKARKVKKITRKCSICGKRMKITVYEDGYYRNGHYFGKLKLPIKGTGKYKKTGTSQIFGKKIDVVEWNGKEKEIEYWECDACYEESGHEEWLEQIIEKLYGKRCPDYEKGCACCQAWDIYDTILDENRRKL